MRHLLVVLLRSEGEEVERVGLVAPGFVHVEALDRIENAFRVGLAEAFIEV